MMIKKFYQEIINLPKEDDRYKNEWLDAYEQGRSDERKKIIEIMDRGDNWWEAKGLLTNYLIKEQLKERGFIQININ